MKNNISVVITTYRNRGHLFEIIKAWLDMGVKVYLANSNPSPMIFGHPNFLNVQFSGDIGNKTRFVVSHATSTDYVLLADDDVLPKPGILEDFWKYRDAGILGLFGRKFNGEPTYLQTKHFRADKVEQVQDVSFVGVVYFTHRKHLVFDLNNLKNSALDDLYWQLLKMPKVKKYVIPSKNYIDLPECNDAEGIFHSPGTRDLRNEFYKKYGGKNAI